jgi:hypothetical protein
MANTLGNPTSKSNAARENEILSYNTTLTASPSIANPLLRIREGSTTLVDFPLNATTPFTGGSVDGSATFNFTAASAVAVGGAADVPDNYQVIGRDNAVHLSGPITATDGITVGQTVDVATITATEPAS